MERHRILVIDDEPDVASMLAVMLGVHGADVDAVCDGFEQLLHQARWAEVDSAVVDLMLPGGLDGGAILDWLAAHAPHVRRVAFTAMPLELVGEVNAEVILPKPSSSQAVLAAVQGPRPRRRWPRRAGG